MDENAGDHWGTQMYSQFCICSPYTPHNQEPQLVSSWWSSSDSWSHYLSAPEPSWQFQPICCPCADEHRIWSCPLLRSTRTSLCLDWDDCATSLDIACRFYLVNVEQWSTSVLDQTSLPIQRRVRLPKVKKNTFHHHLNISEPELY